MDFQAYMIQPWPGSQGQNRLRQIGMALEKNLAQQAIDPYGADFGDGLDKLSKIMALNIEPFILVVDLLRQQLLPVDAPQTLEIQAPTRILMVMVLVQDIPHPRHHPA